jgi:hypothetical protein
MSIQVTEWLFGLVKAHPIAFVLLLSFAYSAFVDGMPDPTGRGLAYTWLYKSAHSLAGNISEARKKFQAGGSQ